MINNHIFLQQANISLTLIKDSNTNLCGLLNSKQLMRNFAAASFPRELVSTKLYMVQFLYHQFKIKAEVLVNEFTNELLNVMQNDDNGNESFEVWRFSYIWWITNVESLQSYGETLGINWKQDCLPDCLRP